MLLIRTPFKTTVRLNTCSHERHCSKPLFKADFQNTIGFNFFFRFFYIYRKEKSALQCFFRHLQCFFSHLQCFFYDPSSATVSPGECGRVAEPLKIYIPPLTGSADRLDRLSGHLVSEIVAFGGREKQFTRISLRIGGVADKEPPSSSGGRIGSCEIDAPPDINRSIGTPPPPPIFHPSPKLTAPPRDPLRECH